MNDINLPDEEEEFQKMSGFLMEFSEFFDDQYNSNQKRVNLWETSIKNLFSILKQIMQVSERNNNKIMKFLQKVDECLQAYTNGDAFEIPRFSEKLDLLDITQVLDQLKIDEENAKPDFQLKSMKSFVKYL